MTVIPVVISALGTVTKGLVQGLINKRTSGDHSNCNIIEIGQNSKKNPRDLRRLTVTQTPLKNHQVKKTLKRENDNNDIKMNYVKANTDNR